MRIIFANIEVKYSGRGETELESFDRVVIYKGDGSISIHSNAGFKPINYMTQTSEMIETEENDIKQWVFKNKKEALTITFNEIYSEVNFEMSDPEPGHTNVAGTENQLQEWLMKNIQSIDPSITPISREHQTGAGPVDILARNNVNNSLVAVEVKRVAAINTVGQVLRYIDALREQQPDETIEGVIAAVEIKQRTIDLAAKKNIKCITVPTDWIGSPVEVEKFNIGLFKES